MADAEVLKRHLEESEVFADLPEEAEHYAKTFSSATTEAQLWNKLEVTFKYNNITAAEAMDVDKQKGDNFVATDNKKRAAVYDCWMNVHGIIGTGNKSYSNERSKKHKALETKVKNGLSANPGFETLRV